MSQTSLGGLSNVWKKNDSETAPSSPAPKLAATPPSSHSDSRSPTGQGTATIGPSIVIKGDISGREDLVIEGVVEGEVSLRQHNVTVGRNGKAKADIHGKNISIEGEVRGNLFGEDVVVIHETGTVVGNITAPRVSLENGSTFKGTIDMGTEAESGAKNHPGTSSSGHSSGSKPNRVGAKP